jgi:cytosine/adenosine deaminase-related metal-dependent hydrolase
MIILKNTTYIDWESFEFKHGNVLVESGIDGKVKIVKTLPELNSSDIVIDGKGKYVTKSFACGHHHSYSAMATGMPAPVKVPGNFYEILKYVWWNLDKALDLEMVKYSAYLTAIACAKAGTTFIIDHHASPFAIEGCLETIANAFEEVGVQHLLCYEVSDRDGVDIANKGLTETDNYLKNHQGLVGVHASFTLTKKTLANAVKLAEKHKTGVHVHVAEDLYDQEQCYEIHGKRIIERFRDCGILELPQSIFAHCIYLTGNERDMIRDSGIYVVQNTDSNLNNSVGIFKSCSLGKNIMYGTDGMHSDMLRSAKMSFLIGQDSDPVDFNLAYERLRNVHRYIQKNNFSGDGDNNLLILDYQPATYFDTNNFLGHLIYSVDTSHIQHVISNGKLIVNDRQMVNVNETEIKQYSRELSRKLWEKMQKQPI